MGGIQRELYPPWEENSYDGQETEMDFNWWPWTSSNIYVY